MEKNCYKICKKNLNLFQKTDNPQYIYNSHFIELEKELEKYFLENSFLFKTLENLVNNIGKNDQSGKKPPVL